MRLLAAACDLSAEMSLCNSLAMKATQSDSASLLVMPAPKGNVF
jgi:hypothetical protein